MRLFELIYFSGYSFKKYCDLKSRKRLPFKVISVGNITTGGTGKTPAVIALTKEAKRRGHQPCILTRGYKGKIAGPCFVSNGKGSILSVDDAGDEAVLMAEKLKDVPIVKSADRYEGGMFALKNLNIKSPVFILDDGFQHWRLKRDMDVLLIDSANPFGNMRLLPLGILREPLRELKRADVVVITRARLSDTSISESLINKIRDYNRDAPIFLAEHRPTQISTPSGRAMPVESVSGKRVFLFCGIGNPFSFKENLLKLNADIADVMFYNDHHRYSIHDIAQISKKAKEAGADWIVTTEKDIMRLKDFELPENIISLCIEFRIDYAFYERVFEGI